MIDASTSAWALSGKLLTVIGRSKANHTMLRENVATYLTQLKPGFLVELEEVPEDKLVSKVTCAYSQGSVDMVQKLSRDLAQKPYEDAAVLQRLQALETELKDKVSQTIQGSASYPCQFFLAGSLLKGRFGANSDLDVLCQASPEWSKSHFRHAFDPVSVQYLRPMEGEEQARHLASFGAVRPLQPSELESPGLLTRLYQEGIERRGYRLEDGHLRAASPTILREVEVAPTDGSINWSAPSMM